MASAPEEMKPELVVLPITALSILQHDEVEILMIGTGNLLEAHNVINGQRLCRSSVFERQAIHGIIVVGRQQKPESWDIELLVYGGRQVAWVTLSIGLELQSRAIPLADLILVQTCWLQDWVICLKSRMPYESSAVLLTSYNALYSIKANRSPHELQCAVLCQSLSTFLYSADVLEINENSFIVASGTAFGELLIWLCRLDVHDGRWQAYPWREYCGHSGSIFGVCISPAIGLHSSYQRLVATCSDDRTIHVWNASGIEDATARIESDAEIVEDVSKRFTRFEKDLAMTWAHLSRIWSVKFGLIAQAANEKPSALILSTGEDGQAQSWRLKIGEIFSSKRSEPPALANVYTDRHHAGKNIWARCLSRKGYRTQMFTGGADGQVIRRSYDSHGHADDGSTKLAQPFKAVRPTVVNDRPVEAVLRDRPIVFKSYLVTGTNQVVATTESGLLLTGNINEGASAWQLLAQSSDSRHLVLSSNLAQQDVLFVDRSRSILCIVDINTSKVRDVCNLRSTKVSTVQIAWSEVGRSHRSPHLCVAVSYFGRRELELIWVMINTSSVRASRTLVILPENFETTSACVDKGAEVLLLGSRAGAVAVYAGLNDCAGFANTAACRRRVHGEDTVTSITALKKESDASREGLFYLTTGRDGTYCALQLNLQFPSNEDNKYSRARLHIAHRATPPLGPHIEGAQLAKQSDSTQKLILYGFRSKQFLVWDDTNLTQVMAVDCGGAHRSWHFHLGELTSEGGTFVWTKAGTFMYYSQTRADHQVIQPGGHGREIKALAVHYLASSRWLIATGSEDTDIRLFEYTINANAVPQLKNISVIRKHTTGLQDLHFSPDGTTLISAAGMEELFAWHLSPVPVLGQGVVFAGSLARADAKSDARIMSIDVKSLEGRPEDDSLLIVAAFSNGKVKVIQYNPRPDYAENATFTVLSELDLGTVCLTQAHLLPNHFQAMVGATNGFLTSFKPLQQEPITPGAIAALHKIHQNSVTTMQVVSLTPTHNLIVTGGDDSSLALTIAHQSRNPSSKLAFGSLSIPKAHAAALTALSVVAVKSLDTGVRHFAIITAGNDQCLQTWLVTIDTTSLRTEEQSSEDRNPGSVDNSNDQRHTANEIQVELLEERYTNVADISEIAVLQIDKAEESRTNAQAVQVVVVGVGMEVLNIELPYPVA